MKTIIVPTDFSEVADNAMNYAAALAADTHSRLLLFHVYQVPVSVTDTPIVLISVEDLQKEAETKIEALKNKLQQISSKDLKIYAETKLGDTTDELENLCEKIKPFAVVMGTNGSTGLERVIFGSTTLSTVKHLTCPVIVIPSGKQYSPIKRIGFACDFKQVVETTPTDVIKSFVKELKADLYVLNVDHNDKSFNAETPEQSLLLHTLLEDLKPKYSFIESESVEDGVNKFAESNNLDLVITIPKKHKLLEGLFRKNHTKELVFHAQVPIMCVHE